MTHEETVLLVGYVQACCPQQAFAKHTPDAWHDILGDLEFGAAKRAAAAVCRQRPFCSPAEILAEAYRVVATALPHSQSCRQGDHAPTCRTSWCRCVCHGVPEKIPAAIEAPQ